MAFIIKKCPHCGEELMIPDDLGTVICMYCGQSFEGVSKTEPSAPGNTFDEELRLAYEALCAEITLPKPDDDVFTKISYPEAFNRFCKCFEHPLDHLDNAFELCPDDKKDEILFKYGKRIAEDVMLNIEKAQGSSRIEMQFLCSRHLVAFILPALKRHSGKCENILTEAIVNTWNGKYKKNKIAPTSFEEINTGFSARSKFCYITTAVCGRMGKPDDCYELRTLRSFRDNYLANQPMGMKEIGQYYLFAPMILKRIDDDNEYDRIYDQYLKLCIEDIEKGDNEDCRRRYRRMVSDLREKWFN